MRFATTSRKNTARLTLLALGCLFLLGCSKKSGTAEDEDAVANPNDMVAEVTLTRVGRADVSSSLNINGTISALPNQDVRVSSLVPGRVARMTVAEGDHVQGGQVLAKIDDRPFQDQVHQAEAAVEQAKANLDNARLSRDRNENLFQRGIAARKDLEDARTLASVDESAVRQAEALLALARLQLARTEVRSPLDGTVVKRLVSVGEQVDGTAAQPIFDVANVREVELFGSVPAPYLARIHTGQTLRIFAGAFPPSGILGTVVAISPAVDPATNVGLVRIRMANGAGLLRLGMFLSAAVPLETHVQALVVPPQAVYRDQSGQAHVYRVQGENAEAVPVKLGLETQGQVELLSGVKEGELIILTGGYGLPEHAKVKVKS
jgi:membrane fusion protein, multidrug efflux system